MIYLLHLYSVLLFHEIMHVSKFLLLLLQRIRSTVDEKEQKQLLMDLEVVMKSNDCIYIVQFFGAIFKEVSVCYVYYQILNAYISGEKEKELA